MQEESKSRSPVLVAVAGMVLPGLGYILVGERKRGIIVGLTLLLMFLSGILIAGIRVFEVPGYNEEGWRVYVEYYAMDGGLYPKQTTEPAIDVKSQQSDTGRTLYAISRRSHDGSIRQEIAPTRPSELMPVQWLLLDNFRGEIANRIWFVPQALMGLPTAVAGYFSVSAAQANVPRSHARLAEIGTLYTAVAGMLNLLVVIDAACRCGRREQA